MKKKINLELYAWFDERRKVPIKNFVNTDIVNKYVNEEIYKTFKMGYFIIRHKKQKFEIMWTGLTTHISFIVHFINEIYQKETYSYAFISEDVDYAIFYSYYSFTDKLVKIVYLDDTMKRETKRNESKEVWSILEIVESYTHGVHAIYTKKKISQEKIPHHHYESEITLPLDIFFGDFYEQVAEHWRILKKAGFITDSWEVLEKSKQVVDEMRIKLQNIE